MSGNSNLKSFAHSGVLYAYITKLHFLIFSCSKFFLNHGIKIFISCSNDFLISAAVVSLYNMDVSSACYTISTFRGSPCISLGLLPETDFNGQRAFLAALYTIISGNGQKRLIL